jgi:hypothetical protein
MNDYLLPRNMRGAKWANAVTYWSEEDRRKVFQAVETAKRCVEPSGPYGPRSIGVRVASYIGEPHPICVITYGPGGSRIYGSVYR